MKRRVLLAMVAFTAASAWAGPYWDLSDQTWTAIAGNIHYDSLLASGDRDPTGFSVAFGPEDLCAGSSEVSIAVPITLGGSIQMEGTSVIAADTFTAGIVNGGPYDFPYDLNGTILQLQARNLNVSIAGTIADAHTITSINGSGDGNLYLRNFVGVYVSVGPVTLDFQNLTITNVIGAVPVHRLAGRLTLADYSASSYDRSSSVRIGAATFPLHLTAEGDWSLCAAYSGNPAAIFSAPGWLSRSLTRRDLSAHDVVGLDVELPNGDAVVSGEVDDADLTTVILNFGTSGQAVTHDTGDVNGDGIVDDSDLTVVILAFGLASDQ